MRRNIFITGGTECVARKLITQLLENGPHSPGACSPRLGAETAFGLRGRGWRCARCLVVCRPRAPSDTFVRLVGVAHPSPAKAAEFHSIDLVPVRASVSAASAAGIAHFVYVSVAQPAPVMKGYQAVRAHGEQMIWDSGMKATILLPWYVLGEGHSWPYPLLPMYWLFERIQATRDSARRLGLVTLDQMVAALAAAVETSADQIRIVDVPSIKSAASPSRKGSAAVRTVSE